jgi:hypothetical protein
MMPVLGIAQGGVMAPRAGDRVFGRLPVVRLRAGPPRPVLSWKDRVVLGPIGEGR